MHLRVKLRQQLVVLMELRWVEARATSIGLISTMVERVVRIATIVYHPMNLLLLLNVNRSLGSLLGELLVTNRC